MPKSDVGPGEGMEFEPVKKVLEGWASIEFTDWHHATVFSNERPDMAETSFVEWVATRGVIGYVRAVSDKEIALDLRGTANARWALWVFRSPDDELPFYIVQGCKVLGIQVLHAEPPLQGFIP